MILQVQLESYQQVAVDQRRVAAAVQLWNSFFHRRGQMLQAGWEPKPLNSKPFPKSLSVEDRLEEDTCDSSDRQAQLRSRIQVELQRRLFRVCRFRGFEGI